MGTGGYAGMTHICPPLRLTPIKGGTAGNHTLTGIATVDKLLSVISQEFGTDGAISTVSDLTSEFTIGAANTINNTGGTNTTNALLLVQWYDHSRTS